MRINWFSPLPNARTGIAHYAGHVLPALAADHELVLWSTQAEVDPSLSRFGQIFRFGVGDAPWPKMNDADFSMYHLGNNADFHGDILDISRDSPGITVLHDLRLHDMTFMLWTSVRKDPAKYLEIMERWYGREGLRAGEAFRAGGLSPGWMAETFPLTREAVTNAMGVVTHSDALRQMGEPLSCPSVLLPHPYAAMDDAAYERVRALRVEHETPPFQLLVLGYLGRNRRVDVILQAFAQVQERDRFHLNICGLLTDASRIQDLILDLGLGELVSLTGFLDDGELHRQLIAADLALNLRYPSMGEASGSQCRLWDYGVPTLVTQVQWYASLPQDAVAFVRPDHEIEDIRAHLESFLEDPEAYAAKGAGGRRALRHHDPAHYARALVEFATQSRAHMPRIAALSLAERTGRQARDWLPGTSAPALFDRVEKEIWLTFGQPVTPALSAQSSFLPEKVLSGEK